MWNNAGAEGAGGMVMQIERDEITRDTIRLGLTGTLDIAGAQALEKTINEYKGIMRAVVLDMTAVSYVASMGLRTLIKAAKDLAAAHGKMVLMSPNSEVSRVLFTTSIDLLIPIYASRESALAAVQR